MRRREFIAGLGGAAAWPLVARGQQERLHRIGALMFSAENDPEAQMRVNTIQKGFLELGWTEGRNIRIDYRWTAGDKRKQTLMLQNLLDHHPMH